MAERVEALVQPQMLIWARTTAGYSIEDAARKLQAKPARLESWESGEARPTINQLRKMSRVYKRPLAAFYLPEPPKDFVVMNDFRRQYNKEARRKSPILRFGMRQAEYRRDVALQLYEELGEAPPTFEVSADIHEAPEVLAARLRRLLNISYEVQTSWRGDYQALNGWREALEQLGILVFQTPGVERTEMRGFSISARPLPVIAVNSKDAVVGRVFSMMHELVHIVLNESGICDLMEGWLDPAQENYAEVFCNRVAGALLVPANQLTREPEVQANKGETAWVDGDLESLARRYRVSRETILRRLLILDRTSEGFYQHKRQQYQEEWQAIQVLRKGKKVVVPRETIAVSRTGGYFTRLVLEGYAADRITGTDVTRFLDVSLKYLPAIRDAVFSTP